MKNLQKGFIGTMVLIVLGVLVVGSGAYIYFQKAQTPQKTITQTNGTQEPLTQENVPSSSSFSNVAGFSFSVPAGWHIWEGASAGQELLLSDSFISVMDEAIKETDSKKTISAETAQKIKPYQEFMNNWTVSTAKTISFTSANVDYKNRDLGVAGKIMSTLIDSQDMIDQHAITMAFSSQTLKPVTPTNDTNSEKKNITINGTSAVYARYKKYKLVDQIIIKVPINTKGDTHTLIFHGFVKKDDTSASDAIVSFISDLNIKGNN